MCRPNILVCASLQYGHMGTCNRDMRLNIVVLHIGTNSYLHGKFHGPSTSLSRPEDSKAVCIKAFNCYNAIHNVQVARLGTCALGMKI